MQRDERDLLASLPQGLFVDGTWRPASGGATFDVTDPATGSDLGVAIADGTAADATAALDAAVAAQAAWGATPPRERSEILYRTFQGCLARRGDLALAMTLEMGKPLTESDAEVTYGAEFFRWFAEEAVRIDGRYTVAPGGDGRIVVTSRPVGPALLITPWNFPLAMLTRKIAAAAAAGCTMVCKPAALTPITAVVLFEILTEAGMPPGVCNLVTTTDSSALSDTLLADDRLAKLSFTGSTAVGRQLAASAGANLQRVSLELGGNAPFVVLADADLDAAVEGAVAAKMRNGGEACTAANRFLVHASIAEDFTAALAGRLAALRPGRGTDAGVDVGPVIRESDLERIADLVADAVDRGAKVRTGGAVLDRPGWFYAPTVLSQVPPDAEVLHTEIFGPVAPVVSFDTVAEAVDMANATDAGLVSFLYTRDLDAAVGVAEALEAGMVGINRGVVSNPAAPFGGIGSSGIGREGGAEGIEEYREIQYLAVAHSG